MLELVVEMSLKVRGILHYQSLMYYIALYRKIVSYVLLRSGLGSPTDIGVVREATGKNYFPNI